MIPIRVRHRSHTKPLVTAALVVACIAVFVRLAFLPESLSLQLVRALAVVPAQLFASPFRFERLLTLITASFLHAGWLHLIGNMLYLVVFGPAAEDRLGHLRFLAVYLIAGAVGMLAQALVHPSSTAPVVGASASIAGILGAYLVLLPKSQVTTVIPVLIAFEVASLPAVFLIGVWFLIQLAGAIAASPTGPQTAWWAHVAGLSAGVVLAFAFRRRGGQRWRRE